MTFNDWIMLDQENYEHEDKGAFSIFTTSQIVRFDCDNMKDKDLNMIIDVMLSFDCPLYDPQIDERFDGEL